MQLIVSGSTQQYIPGSNPPLEEIRLLITKKYLTLLYGSFNLNFPNRESISAFSSRIASTDHPGILDALHEFRFYELEEAFRDYNADQVYLFKSVFIIYDYVEEQHLEKVKGENGRKLYDKLLLDKRPPSEESRVLYFIRENYLDEIYLPILKKLVALRLLCQLRLLGLPVRYTTYFTTLNHNSVSKSLLNGGVDESQLISLWKMIQEDKRIKMYNSYNLSS